MERKSVYTQELIDKIIKFQEQKKPLRKATFNDIFCSHEFDKVKYKNKINSNDKIKSFRKQEEFGQKKRIKP
jgi:hypothetical protein